MKKIICTILITASLTLPPGLKAQHLIDYTHYPLSATHDVPPSILIIMDNSVSMNLAAYEGDFNPGHAYDGYFAPSAAYSYAGGGYFERNDTGPWKGNFLNWLTMRRIDMVRKVLIGGKALPGTRNESGTSHLAGEEVREPGYEIIKQYADGAGLFYPPPAALGLSSSSPVYFGVAEGFIYVGSTPDPVAEHVMQLFIRVVKENRNEPGDFRGGEIAGLLHSMVGRARMGLAIFNDDGEGARITNPVGDELHNLVYTIENSSFSPWSPLAESFFEGVCYFMQIPPYYSHTPADYRVDTQDDPFFFEECSEVLSCVQSYIILITDGESTHDQQIPPSPPGTETANLRDYDADGRDTVLSPEEGSHFLDDIALWAHTIDLRQEGPDNEGKQSVTLFTIPVFGSGSEILRSAAKNGGFLDLNGNGYPDVPREWDTDQDGTPDTYYEAEDASLLGEKLMQAPAYIFTCNASAGGVSLASQSFQDEATIFQSFYKADISPQRTSAGWRGFLHALWLDPFGNMREDTDRDKALVYDRDTIIRFALEEDSSEGQVQRFSDADGDGKADRDTPDAVVPVSMIHPLWEAGEKLALRNAGERTIISFVDINNNGAVDAGESLEFIPEQAPLLRPFLRAQDDTEAASIISYIRGEDIAGLRKRTAEAEPPEMIWKLGDIVQSAPAISKQPSENYHIIYGDGGYEAYLSRWKERPLTLFVGANDGMLHAFNGGVYHQGDNPQTADKTEEGWYTSEPAGTRTPALGDELWAYIPCNILPHLKWLTRNDYTHVDYVDLKPKLADVRVFTDSAGSPIDGDHPHGWGTILIGGMGLGGGTIEVADDFGSGNALRTFRSAYFALDVTIPHRPRVLWEFTHPRLGFTTSYPCMVRVEESGGLPRSGNERWFVIFGSGPTDYRGNSTQAACIFVVDLKTGALVRIIEGQGLPGFMGSPISIDANLDFSTDSIYAGESFLAAEQWQGSMHRLSTRNCTGDECITADPWTYATNPEAWTSSNLFSSPLPVTATPGASLDGEQNLWFFFGTGRYFGFSDRFPLPSENLFLGIKDPCYRGGCTVEVPLSRLYDASPVMVYRDGTIGGTSATTWNDLVRAIGQRQGWYLNLSPGGERVLSKPSILGGLLAFTAYTPDEDVCSGQGISTLYTLYYQTGSSWVKPLFLPSRKEPVYSGDGQDDSRDAMQIKKTLGQGMSASPAIHLGITPTMVLPLSGTALETIPLSPPLKVKSGMESWREE